MQRLGKNIGRYLGDTIDIQHILRELEIAALKYGWNSETFFESGDVKLFALTRPHSSSHNPTLPIRKFYLSAGIHGDEPGGPLAALKLIQENQWPENADLWFCPCLNPVGFTLNTRENARGIDLNREYLNPDAEEIKAHLAWFARQPDFDLCVLMHEDWESHGFYLYEQNPDGRPSLAEAMIDAVSRVCPVDPNEIIEDRPAKNGIIRPSFDPRTRPRWPEAFYLIMNKTRRSYTLEAPSDFPLITRRDSLVAAARAAMASILAETRHTGPVK